MKIIQDSFVRSVNAAREGITKITLSYKMLRYLRLTF